MARGIISAILAGSALTPAAAQMLVGDGTVPCGTSYVIESGDTLSGIAEHAYGDPQLYGFIADANWDALGGNIENIAVGMSLTIPCVDASGQVMTEEQTAEVAATLEAAVAVEGMLQPAELDALLGPVALFPDPVLTPVLVATTFPLDVVKAARFAEETEALTDQERAAQAVDQPWDESVRELAAGFPDLVIRMSEHIDWTEQAGEAVVAQTDDVLASIQRLRAKAMENGYLVDNDAQIVEEVGDTIVINPASPGVVYVPVYDSEVVYTTQVVGDPFYHYGYIYDDDDWEDALIAGGIFLGAAIILDEIFDDDDWHGWGDHDEIDWDGGDITIDRGDINIDRGDINIGDGDRPQIGDGDRPQIGDGDRPQIGDGDRPQIGDGDRVSIGDSDRPQVDRGDLETVRDNVGSRPGVGTLPANRTPISTDASREVARKKIEARKATGAKPANLPASRLQSARPTATKSRAASQPRPSTRAAPVSRPSVQRTPTARAPSRSNTFSRSSGGSRASAASSRGRSSMGSRGGSRGGRSGGRR